MPTHRDEAAMNGAQPHCVGTCHCIENLEFDWMNSALRLQVHCAPRGANWMQNGGCVVEEWNEGFENFPRYEGVDERERGVGPIHFVSQRRLPFLY